MLTKKGDEYIISDYSQIREIQIFLKQNLNNPKIEQKAVDELYSLYIYLHNLCCSEYFSLPLLILKPDPPDFILAKQDVGHKTGIEIVTSATQAEKQAFAIRDKKYPKGSLIEIPYYVPGSRASPTDGIRKPNELLKHNGFGDHGAQKAWLDCICQRLNEKTCKLNKNKNFYSQYQSNQLIIYDDTDYFPDGDYVIAKLRQDYKSSTESNFDSVHIIMNIIHLFVFDVFGSYKAFNIPSDII
jgi:hypothetical protein